MNNLIKLTNDNGGGITKILTQYAYGKYTGYSYTLYPTKGYLINEVFQFGSNSSSEYNVRATMTKDGVAVANSGAISLSGSPAMFTTFITDIAGDWQNAIATSYAAAYGQLRTAFIVPKQPTVNTCEFLLCGNTKTYTVQNKSCLVTIADPSYSSLDSMVMKTNNVYRKLTEFSKAHCYYFSKASEISLTLTNNATQNGASVAIYEF